MSTNELCYEALDGKSSAEIAAAGSPLAYQEAAIRAVQKMAGRSVVVVHDGVPFGLPTTYEFSPESRSALLHELEHSFSKLRALGNTAIHDSPSRSKPPQDKSSEEAIQAAQRDGLISEQDASDVRTALGIV